MDGQAAPGLFSPYFDLGFSGYAKPHARNRQFCLIDLFTRCPQTVKNRPPKGGSKPEHGLGTRINGGGLHAGNMPSGLEAVRAWIRLVSSGLPPAGPRRPGREEPITKGQSFYISKQPERRAWLKVRANRGAAGIDDITIAALERRLKINLYHILNRMPSGLHFSPPVKRKMNSEADGNKIRSVPNESIGSRPVPPKRGGGASFPRHFS